MATVQHLFRAPQRHMQMEEVAEVRALEDLGFEGWRPRPAGWQASGATCKAGGECSAGSWRAARFAAVTRSKCSLELRLGFAHEGGRFGGTILVLFCLLYRFLRGNDPVEAAAFLEFAQRESRFPCGGEHKCACCPLVSEG